MVLIIIHIFMATIKPFAALRPNPPLAGSICELPYDVMSSAEARELAAGNPLSFLHVSKPEIDLPIATGLYEPRHIMIDPGIAFGKPCLKRLGVKTDIIADRFLAGETIEDLTADYGAQPEEIQEAIRWSSRKAA